MANNQPILSIRERINEALILCNMKPIDLANATGIPKASISHYLNGKVNPKQDRIYLMAKAFSCDPAWLMGYDVPMERLDPTLKAERDIQLIEMFDKLSESEKSIIINVMKSMIEADEER